MANWEFVFNWKLDGTVAQNVCHYADSGPTSIDWQEVVDTIAGDFTSTVLAIIVPSCSFTGVTVREDIEGSVGTTYAPTGGTIVGTAPNEEYARVLAMLVQKRVTGTVKPVRGRIYQPGITLDAMTSDGEWGSSFNVIMRNFWEDLLTITTINSGVFTMQLKASNPDAPNTNPYNPVASVGVNPVPATQRRRIIGHGV